METENTVTIHIEEYFELRKQSEMNAFLLGEIARNDEHFRRIEDHVFRLEDEMRKMKGEK